MPSIQPSYILLHRSGELARRVDALTKVLEDCVLCPWHCHVNRIENERGVCRSGSLPIVSSHGAHFGEERPLVGSRGSGTIFITNCNLKCVFCQNYDISHLGEGREISVEELGAIVLTLWQEGCHNINFVSPTHQIAQIVAALPYAIDRGLDIPLVYNCGGYENAMTLRLLDGIFDIYMPDFKYGDDDVAMKLSGTPHYVELAMEALQEMHRQVGDLVVDERGVAQRGLLVRHLVLPDGLAGTRRVMEFIAQDISPNTYVNIMDQYRPCYRAHEHPPLNRRITSTEFSESVGIAQEAGLSRLDGITV